MTITRSYCSGNDTTSSSSEQSEKPTSEEDLKILFCFYDTYIYSIISLNTLASERQQHSMTMYVYNEADLLLWSSGTLIVTFQHRRWQFVAQCLWWLSELLGLYPALS